jgi:3-hydroxy-9,10-secoandrosta-1,3,5(10)-triene-9,17-dione monooxygenase reductase component
MNSRTSKPPSAPQFRKALGAFATGVTIVTTRAGDQDIGLTANSFNSVSLDPPMVLWSLARNSLSLPAFLAGDHFAVHVLSAAQEPLSKLFAVRGENKFKNLPVIRGHGDVPLLANCAARFQCRTAYRYEGGDHMIFVGEVLDFDQSELAPLVFHGGRYAIAAPKSMEAIAQLDNTSGFSNDFLIYLLSRAHHQLFLQMRRELLQHGMGEAEWFCLSILSTEGALALAELDKRLADTGIEASYDRLAGLAAADFLILRGGYDPSATAELTYKGRKAVIELIAAAKLAETSIESQLGPDETRVLKQWLRGMSADYKDSLLTIKSAHTESW